MQGHEIRGNPGRGQIAGAMEPVAPPRSLDPSPSLPTRRSEGSCRQVQWPRSRSIDRPACSAGTPSWRCSTSSRPLAILALSFAKSPVVTSPVVGTYLHFDEATRHLVTAQRSDLGSADRAGRGSVLPDERHRPLRDGLPGTALVRGTSGPRPEPDPLDRVLVQLERDDRRHRGPGGRPGSRHADRHLRRQRGHDHVRLEHGDRQRGTRPAPMAALRLRLHRRRRSVARHLRDAPRLGHGARLGTRSRAS